MVILFDIDDTLLNFRDRATDVIRQALAEQSIPFSEEQFAVYHRINNELWQEVSSGRLARETLYAIRWPRVLEALGIQADGALIEARFRYHLSHSAVPEAGAEDALRALHGRHTLCTASNAPQHQQEYRLQACGLAGYFAHIFTSEGLGADKPSPLFFDRLLAALDNPPRESVLMVGDDPKADILGAASAGLRTCLINTRGVPLPPDCHPDHIIPTLAHLPAVIKDNK